MLDHDRPIRKTITIPVECRERYVPLGEPQLAPWVDAGLFHCGVSDLVPGYHIAAESPGALMIIATTGGLGVARTPEQRFELAPGSLFIHPPCSPVEWATAGASWAIVWWYLRDVKPWRSLFSGRPRLLPYAHADLLFRAQDAVIRRLAVDDGDAMAARLGELVLGHLCELAGPSVGGEEDPLARLWAEVGERLHEPWPLERLAKRVHLSVTSLQRRMHERYRTSAHQMLLSLRMARAEELLARTDYPLRVIAEQLAFNDQFAFSSAFRRHRGQPPAHFRARSRSRR
jgi:AraC-like DNA-binding protein